MIAKIAFTITHVLKEYFVVKCTQVNFLLLTMAVFTSNPVSLTRLRVSGSSPSGTDSLTRITSYARTWPNGEEGASRERLRNTAVWFTEKLLTVAPGTVGG